MLSGKEVIRTALRMKHNKLSISRVPRRVILSALLDQYPILFRVQVEFKKIDSEVIRPARSRLCSVDNF